MGQPGGKSLRGEQRERAMAALREFVASQANQSAAAKKLGVSQGYLADVLAGKRGIGMKVLEGLVVFRPDVLAKVLGHESALRIIEQTEPRYEGRNAAIEALVRRGHDPEQVRNAADEVGAALDAEESPDQFWWFEQIETQLKRKRRPGQPPLGVRPLEDD